MEIELFYDQLINIQWELIHSEFLNQHYKTLRRLEGQPGFLMSTMRAYLDRSDGNIMEARNLLRADNVNFEIVHELLFKVKGGAASIGAQRIVRACSGLQDSCLAAPSKEIAMQLLDHLQEEHFLLKSKLEALFEYERLIINACGEVQRWW